MTVWDYYNSPQRQIQNLKNKNELKQLQVQNLGDMDKRDWNNYKASAQRQSSREAELNRIRGLGNTQPASASSSNALFSSSDLLGGSIAGAGLDDMTNRAKDLARFRLGLDTEQARTFRGLREEEAQSNFGRDMQRLQSEQASRIREIQEQFGGQERLSNITQGALTGRLEKELANRLTQQERATEQQNLASNRAIGLASRRLGG